MKKLIFAVVAVICVVALASCSVSKKPNDEKVLETAETVYDVTGNAGSIQVNEESAYTLLGAFSADVLGLEKTIDNYTLKLSSTTVLKMDACLVEAYAEGAESPDGIFAIIGTQCYVYNAENNEYMLLTKDGAVKAPEPTAAVSGEGNAQNTTTTKQPFPYDTENNDRLHEIFKDYSAEELGLDKELSEYILVVEGKSATAQDGETVYIIKIYEKEGFLVEKTLAFNADGAYRHSESEDVYVKL